MSRALGRYELLRPLARGGMAEVYLARRRAAGVEKWLVVKRIRAEYTKDVRFLDLFVREARLSMSLAHQNIVPVFDFGRIDDQVFLAMERVEGKDLGSSLGRTKTDRLAPLLAAFIASECCQALDYAHHRKSQDGAALGIVHRDVTPRNVLLSWSGEVKLTDFGIAALAGDATTKLLGTPAYMAPEQARGEALDARADLYAVGLVLRETLTGERARPGTDRDTILESARTGALIPWPEGIPAGIVAIADRATAPDPDDRFPDARSMLAELDNFMVAERAANKSEAPARGLAAWLADVWEGERDDHGIDGDVEGDHLVSFLDDGALDVMGTGTQRSMLATAAEGDVPAATVLPSAAAGRDAAPSPPEAAKVAPAPAPISRERVTTAPVTRGRSRWIAAIVAAVAVAAVGAVVVAKLAGGDHDRKAPVEVTGSSEHRVWTDTLAGGSAVSGSASASASVAGSGSASGSGSESASASASESVAGSESRSGSESASGSGSASASVAGSGSGSESRSGSGSASASVSVAGSGSASGSAPASGSVSRSGSVAGSGSGPSTAGGSASVTTGRGSGSARPTTTTKVVRPATVRREAGSGSGSALPAGSAVPAVTLRKVTINATPWAYFTVDGDSTQHETVKTLQLAPGKHTIHFTNPVLHVERTVTIEVPSERDLTYVERLGS